LRILLAAFLLLGQSAAALLPEKPFPFKFNEAPLTKVIDFYSTNTGQKFVVDASVASTVRVTIIEPGKVTAKEAFNLLSASLALNSIAISNRDGTLVLASARTMQRSYIPVVTDLPLLQPEKMVTWIITLRHTDANQMQQQVRAMTSKDGELSVAGQNKLLVTDWVSSLYRLRDLVENLDKAPTETKAAAIPDPNKKSL
jgi:type II secretory pathway component GspD/PulD (secretin)